MFLAFDDGMPKHVIADHKTVLGSSGCPWGYEALEGRLLLAGTPDSLTLDSVGQWGTEVNDISVAQQRLFLCETGVLRILDVSNPLAPKELSAIGTQGETRAVAVAGNRVYLAENYGLQVVDITDPQRPVLLGRSSVAGAGVDVKVQGSFAYVADPNLGLQIIDISDPGAPVWKARYDTPGLAYAVDIEGSIAYIADNSAGLQIVDISSPTSPRLLGNYPVAGKRVDVVGSRAYLAGLGSLEIIDVSSPSSPTRLGSFNTNATDVKVVGTEVLLVRASSGLTILDSSNPSSPTVIGTLSGGANVVDAEGDTVYLGKASLRICDVSKPAAITTTSEIAISRIAYGVESIGTTTYIADGDRGLQVLDTSDPKALRRIGGLNSIIATQVEVAGSRAYVADGGLNVLSITDPQNPVSLGRLTISGGVQSIFSVGSLAYVTSGYSGLRIIDVSDPSALTIIGTYDTVGYARGLQVIGTLAFIAEGTGGLTILDVSNPAIPMLRGKLDTPGTAYSVKVINGTAYVADNTSIQIIDVENPASPRTLGTFSASCTTLDGTVNQMVIGGRQQVQVLDLSNPAAPVKLGSKSITGDVTAVALRDGVIWVTNDIPSDGYRYVVENALYSMQVRDVLTPRGRAPGSPSTPEQVIRSLRTSVSWFPVSGATEYGLYISKLQPSGAYSLIFDTTAQGITIPGSSLSYSLPAGVLVDGGQYRWNMNAKINGVWGPYSNRLYFNVSTAPVPATPTGLSVLTADSTSLLVQWHAVAGNGINYKLYRSTSANGPWNSAVYYSSLPQAMDTALQVGTTYYYRVSAVNFSGESPLSPAVSFLLGGVLPPVPTNLTASQTGPNQVTLNWDDVLYSALPGAPVGSDPISLGEYLVLRSDGGPSGFQTIGVVPAGQHSFIDTSHANSTPQTNYTYLVQSRRNGLLSAASVLVKTVLSDLFDIIAPGSALWSAAAADRSNVAKLYKYNWSEPAYPPDAINRPNLWDAVSPINPGIDWTRKTIILTHGWNDTLDKDPAANSGRDYDQEYMNLFAVNYARSHPDDQVNILAVDWYDGGSSLGSDPNGSVKAGLGSFWTPADAIAGDAMRSSLNALLDAYPLADKLFSGASGQLDPTKVMLVGHSNGAGFMAAMAQQLFQRTGSKVAELISLDAPWATLAYAAVYGATRYANRVYNYYTPAIQKVGSVLHVPLLADVNLGAGAPMLQLGSGLRNLELLGNILPNDLSGSRISSSAIIAHNQVPLRFAETANGSGSADPWGYRASEFETGHPDPYGTDIIWTENALRPGHFDSLITISNALATGLATVKSLSRKAVEIASDTLEHLFDLGPSSTPAVSGQNSKLLKPTQPPTPTFTPTPWIASTGYSFGASPGAPVGAEPVGHGAVLASVDVNIPANASFLSLDLTVQDAGNSDILLVGINDVVIGEANLAALKTAGGGSITMPVGALAGQRKTINFYLPTAVPTTAEFLIGNIDFGILTTDRIAPTVSNWKFNYDGAISSLSMTFSEAVGSTIAQALTIRNANTGVAIDSSMFTTQYDVLSNTVTWSFSGFAGGHLPDGNYSVTISSALVLDGDGNSLDGDNNGTPDGDFSGNFFVLDGDANRDRAVNFFDLTALSASYGQSGMTWADGDFNGDGTVNFFDLTALAANYSVTLPAPAAVPSESLPTTVEIAPVAASTAEVETDFAIDATADPVVATQSAGGAAPVAVDRTSSVTAVLAAGPLPSTLAVAEGVASPKTITTASEQGSQQAIPPSRTSALPVPPAPTIVRTKREKPRVKAIFAVAPTIKPVSRPKITHRRASH